MATFKKFETLGLIVLTLLVLADAYFWRAVVTRRPFAHPGIYTAAGNGRAGTPPGKLVVLAGGATLMVDPAPVPSSTAYIDLAIIGNASGASWSGFPALLGRISFGAFLYNGRDPGGTAWRNFAAALRAKHIPLITVGAGDSVRHSKNRIEILSPLGAFWHSPDPLDAGLVARIITPAFQATLTDDVSGNVKDFLAKSQQ